MRPLQDARYLKGIVSVSESVEISELVRISKPRDHVAQITLCREAKRNALSNSMIANLAEAIGVTEDSADIRCVVLTGSENVFSAGADIKEMRDRGIEAITNRSRAHAWATIEKCTKPVIAAVCGTCMGGGHELAMLCDIVIASEEAQFAQPEIKLGHIPGDGATQRLIRLAGKYVAMKMILSGEPISAQEAFRVGLASEVVAQGACLERALELAEQIAWHSPKALSLAKDAVLSAQECSLTQGLAIERRNIAFAFTTNDQKEGLAAFFEKRKPRFAGN